MFPHVPRPVSGMIGPVLFSLVLLVSSSSLVLGRMYKSSQYWAVVASGRTMSEKISSSMLRKFFIMNPPFLLEFWRFFFDGKFTVKFNIPRTKIDDNE